VGGVGGVGAGSGVSSVTGVGAVEMPERSRSRSLPTIALVVMGALVVGSLTVSAVLLRQSSQKSSIGAAGIVAAPTAGDTGTVASAAVVRRPEASAEAKPATTIIENAAPSASTAATSASNSTTAATTTTATATATTVKRSAGGPATGGRVNCDPPYVVDKNGHQHFIPECLK
jgi:amino acid transporter